MNLLLQWQRAAAGETVAFNPKGSSMRGLVDSGGRVVVAPCRREALAVGDIVLVRVKGATYLHKIVAVQGERLLIGNNRGGTNGWVHRDKVAGICTEVAGVERPRLEGKLLKA